MISMAQNQLITKRINRLSKAIAVILRLFGIGAIVAQISKVLPWFADNTAWEINLSQIVASVVGLLFLLLAQGKTIEKVINYSLFSGRQQIKRLVFGFPIIFTLLIVFLLKFILGYNNLSYQRMMSEGSFIEYGTTLAYLLAFGFSVAVAKYFIKTKQKKLGFIYYLLAAFFFVIGLEEISWGQMIFNWDASSVFESHNVQQETNLHNLVWVNNYFYDGAIALSLFGGFSSLIASLLPKSQLKKALKYLTPDWYLSSFFLICLVIICFLKFLENPYPIHPRDQEFAELMLSFGFLLLVLTNYFRQALRSQLKSDRAKLITSSPRSN
jgi:hypothetical protein